MIATPDRDESRAGFKTTLALASGVSLILIALALEWIATLAPHQPLIAVIATAGLTLAVVALGGAAWREWRALRALGHAEHARATVALARFDRELLRKRLEEVGGLLVKQGVVSSQALDDWRAATKFSNASEGVEADFSRLLLKELDRRAVEAVATYVKVASASVTMSPSAAGDLALFLWSALRLLRQVAGIYGLRPGRVSELRLLRRVMADVSVLAATEVMSDTITAAVGGLLTKVAGRAAEAAVAGQRMSRFGLHAIAACRPIPFDARDAPGLRDVMASVVSGTRTAGGSGGRNVAQGV